MQASTTEPRLSIIVPVYNSGELLHACVASLSAQTGDVAVEFICVDDGSTDGSAAVLDAWAAEDARVRVLHQPNGGYGCAMNAGLDVARSEYIGIVEPDDWVEPHFCTSLLKLAGRTGADIAKAAYVGECSGCSRVDERFRAMQDAAVFTPCDFPGFLLGAPSIWSAIYRRSMLVEKGIRFNETPGASFQDLGFFMRTWAAAGCIATTHMALYHYREDNPASSNRRMEDGAWAVLREIELTQDLFDSLKENKPVQRTLLLRRVFHSMMADYKLRVSETLHTWLPACSEILHRLCPQEALLPEFFSRAEWHDLSILYSRPAHYPTTRRLGASIPQRIFSIRTEGGRRYMRLLGAKIDIGKKNS